MIAAFERSIAPTAPGPAIAGRIDLLDVLRGVAVLAIFVVNIKMMAAGFSHYADPTLWTGPWDRTILLVHSRLIDGKFVTIFTALFGAGLALLAARGGEGRTKLILRRLGWLCVFGLMHMIFLREGDILLWYALAGFVVFPFARASTAALALGAVALIAGAYVYRLIFPIPEDAIPLLWRYDAAQGPEVARVMLGSVAGQIAARLEAIPYYMGDLFLIGGVWIDTAGIMLAGMALLKSGFLTGALTARRYWAAAALGLAVASAYYLSRPVFPKAGWGPPVLEALGFLHRFGGAIVWASLVALLVRAGWRPRALAAVGRTAFSVYIAQSAIGLALFTSLGLGLFGRLALPELMAIVAVVIAATLVVAPLWLAAFRFGPLEWAWRSLTYGKVQPMLRSKEAT